MTLKASGYRQSEWFCFVLFFQNGDISDVCLIGFCENCIKTRKMLTTVCYGLSAKVVICDSNDENEHDVDGDVVDGDDDDWHSKGRE